jgi:hypothetical protein
MDSIYRERILRARRTPLDTKLLLGPEFFTGVCRRMAVVIWRIWD